MSPGLTSLKSGDSLGHAIRDERTRVRVTAPTRQRREHDANRFCPRIGPGKSPGRSAVAKRRLRATRAASPGADGKSEPAWHQPVGIVIAQHQAMLAALPLTPPLRLAAVRAEGLRQRMAERYGSARLVQRPENPGVWRVLVGAEPTQEGAGQLAGRIRQDSFEKTACFVVRIDSM